MTVSIMQPYFLPYLGYFQMIHAADTFVLLDDVNFIKKGWINRNQILVNKNIYKITMPLIKASQNKLIIDTEINFSENWQNKLLKTVENSYLKAPHFKNVFPLIEKIILNKDPNLSSYLYYSIQEIVNYLNIKTKIIPSSSVYEKKELKGEDRIIDICIQNKATQYINAIGGTHLYNEDSFTEKNIELRFIDMIYTPYKQFAGEHIPYLSILDVLMFNDIDDVQKLLTNFTLKQTAELNEG